VGYERELEVLGNTSEGYRGEVEQMNNDIENLIKSYEDNVSHN
jgi:hypothetical protein